MRAGELRHRVQFLRKVNTEQDEGGSLPEVWQPTGNPVPCSVVPLSGSKQFMAMQAQSRVTHTITLRYRDGISPHWRVKWGDLTFQIERVIDVESRRRKIEIQAVLIT
jgi:SPP1 family predicted phage head-tail adaptor